MDSKLEEVMSFFSNPFSTVVGHKIEQATESTLSSENWSLNLEICDLINSDNEMAKDAIRAIKKRLQSKNYTVVMFTLTLLETCVKNCSHGFHLLVCNNNKEFINEMVKVISSKNNPPQIITEKTLSLIQSWSDTFKTDLNLQGVVMVYEELKSKGIEFPATDLDQMAPIILQQTLTRSGGSSDEPILHPVVLPTNLKPTATELVKLREDLSIVQGNMTVFSEIMSEVKPDEQFTDSTFLKDLYDSCKEMQKRIANLLCISISDDELVSLMLHLNDELNNLFLRYKRYCKNTEKFDNSLIDLQPTVNSGAIPKINAITTSSKQSDEFDMFAQSRNSNHYKISSTYLDNATKIPETTLATKPKQPSLSSQNPSETTLSSSEFDKFLAERAAANK